MGEISQTGQVVPEAVLVRNPCDGDQSCLPVDVLSERIDRCPPCLTVHNTHLKSPLFCQLLVQKIRCVIVEIIDDDVVTLLQVQCSRDDVLPVACREKDPNLHFACANKGGEALPHEIGLLQHTTQTYGISSFGLREGLSSFHGLKRRWCDVC